MLFISYLRDIKSIASGKRIFLNFRIVLFDDYKHDKELHGKLDSFIVLLGIIFCGLSKSYPYSAILKRGGSKPRSKRGGVQLKVPIQLH